MQAAKLRDEPLEVEDGVSEVSHLDQLEWLQCVNLWNTQNACFVVW